MTSQPLTAYYSSSPCLRSSPPMLGKRNLHGTSIHTFLAKRLPYAIGIFLLRRQSYSPPASQYARLHLRRLPGGNSTPLFSGREGWSVDSSLESYRMIMALSKFCPKSYRPIVSLAYNSGSRSARVPISSMQCCMSALPNSSGASKSQNRLRISQPKSVSRTKWIR